MDWYQTTHNKEYTTILYFDCIYIYIDRLSIFNWWWVDTCDANQSNYFERHGSANTFLFWLFISVRMLLNLYGFVSVIMDHIIMKNYHNGHEFGFSFLDPAYFWIGGETL